MRQSIAFLSLLASAACAEDVISFIFPGGFDGDAPVATIESAGPSTTAALLTCPTGTSSEDCGFAMGLEVNIIGGTRYEASMAVGDVSASYGCEGFDAAAQTITCTAELSGEGKQTAVLSGTDVAFITATVVEGAELLSGGASATPRPSASAASASASTSTSAPSSSATAASSVSSGMQTSTAASGTAATGSNTASPTAQSTGAAAKFGIEGVAFLALAGAAAVNVL